MTGATFIIGITAGFIGGFLLRAWELCFRVVRCHYCGKRTPMPARFCRECGERLARKAVQS
jgi:hypothetical protein